MEFMLGIVAALIGAGGAFFGAWLSGRHERQLEHEKWERIQRDEKEDARAAAVQELTKHLASALHEITWFTTAATMRAPLFQEKSILDYDAAMHAHLTATIESLVAVAHHDKEAYRILEQLTRDVWQLDWQVASHATSYWTDPDATRTSIGEAGRQAIALEMSLPRRIVDVLHREGAESERAYDLNRA
ncbi:MAG: hypothetical protein M3265_01635 [Actinomycetota bacterium]|nr:hypothetical protein [Actinomycetota bacterium]